MGTNKEMTLALAASVILAALPAAGQDRPGDLRSLHLRFAAYGQSRGPEQTERFSKTFRVGPSGSLDLSNLSGDVTVTGGSGTDIVVSAVKHARDRDPAQAKQDLASVLIEATERAGRVEVRVAYPPGTGEAPGPRGGQKDAPPPPPDRARRAARHLNVDVDFTVTVPSNATAYLRSLAGSIRVSNVKGELRAEAMSGTVEASNTGKTVWLKSLSGDVSVAGADPGGDLTVSTMSGRATARNIRARGLDASTVSGDIYLLDVVCDRASVRSINGAVEYKGEFAKSGRYEIRAHAGNVSLALGQAPGFEIEAETFSGSIRSDLPITERPGSGQEGHSRGPRRQTLRGTYGDGSAVVQIRTFSGNITIVKR